MRKQRDIYASPLNALVSVSKQLGLYENQHGMDSETFFDRYQKGLIGDEAKLVEWANAYLHYVTLYQQLESHLRDDRNQALCGMDADDVIYTRDDLRFADLSANNQTGLT